MNFFHMCMCIMHIVFCTVCKYVLSICKLFCFFALSGARSQEFHSPRHLCCGDVTIKVIWFDLNYSPLCRSKPVRPLFIFGTQIKIFLMKSESLHCGSVMYMCRILTRKKRNCWIKSLFLLSLSTKGIVCSFIKLQSNHWCHMDYFNDVLTTFLGLEPVSCVAVLSMEGQKALAFH